MKKMEIREEKKEDFDVVVEHRRPEPQMLAALAAVTGDEGGSVVPEMAQG